MVSGKKLGRAAALKRNTVAPTLAPIGVPHSSETQAPSPESVVPSIVPSSVPPEIVHSSETQAPSPSQPNINSSETQAPSPSQPNVLSPTSQTSVASASKSRRVRGPTVGKGTDKLLASNRGNKLYVPIVEGLNALGSELSTPAANELGIYIRRMCPIHGLNSWSDVDPATKAAIVQSVRDKFSFGADFEINPTSQHIVDSKCYILHKDWRSMMKQHFHKLMEEGVDPYSKPFKGVIEEDWKYLIDCVWSDPTKQKRYNAGKLNRGKLPCNHTSGSRSFPAALTIAAEANGGQLPNFCDFYKTTHTSKKTHDWIDPKCSNLHDEMVRVRDESVESGMPMTQEEISIAVLGKRKGYLKGFGVGPKPSSSESGSTAASRAREEEMERLRIEVEMLRANQQRSLEAQEQQREEMQRQERQREEMQRQERQREEMQRQIFGLQSLVAQIMEGRGGDDIDGGCGGGI